MNILIDNKEADFREISFPILIHGAEKTGTSFFSICLLANLVRSGMQALIFSAYPAAKEEFRKQIIGYEDNCIIIDSGEEQVFIEALKNIRDLDDRVVLIKNIDKYTVDLFNAVSNLKLVIFSGDLDNCEFANNLVSKNISSKILFSPSEKYPQYDLVGLPQYYGKIFSDQYSGVINLDIEK